MSTDLSPPPLADHDSVLRATLYGNQRLWLLRLATGQMQPPPRHAAIWRSPHLTAARTGRTGVICLIGAPPREDVLAALADVREWFHWRGSGDVLVWSAEPRPDLALPLAAHGLEPSFQPHWMARALPHHIPRTSSTAEVDIRLARPGDLDDLCRAPGIPYVSVDQLPALAALLREPARERRVWLLLAREQAPNALGPPIGQAIVNICDGPAGRFAGLYNLGVAVHARRRGIGRALTIAACNLAHDLGARHMGLNATPDGEPLYASLGFAPLGTGQTWLLPAWRLAAPDDDAVALAMAIATGTLADIAPAGPIPLTLPNGESPLAFAARTGDAAAARWLLGHGAKPEIVPLWRLGLREEAIALLADREAVNRRIPPQRTTPLHEAVRDGDAELARLLIDAGADLGATDAQFHSTPLGWAEALGRDEIAAMLREAESARMPAPSSERRTLQ